MLLHHSANPLITEPFDPLIQPFKVSGHTFTVDTRYSFANARIMGRGSFGIVTRAFDTVRGVNVAIKRVRPFAEDIWDAVHHLREIKIIKHLSFHPNIISLYNLSVNEAKKELYMFLELMDSDLARIINSGQPLTEQHFKCFLKQILEGVSAMHDLNIFHRDLKPGNILLTKDCHIRIADLGLARYMHASTLHGDNTDKPMTHAVVTTWYRCLELLLAPNTMPYSAAVDMWSIGCIFAELLMRKALFPGKNHIHQIQCIFHIVGHIPPEELGFPLTPDAKTFLKQSIDYQYRSFESLVPSEFATEDALAMLSALLVVNPAQRITAKEALTLPYLQDALTYYDYDSIEYPSERKGDMGGVSQVESLAEEFFFEEENVSLTELKQLLQDEVALFDASAYRKPTVVSPLSTETADLSFMSEKQDYRKEVARDESGVSSSSVHDTTTIITQAKIDDSQSTTVVFPSEAASQHNNNNNDDDVAMQEMKRIHHNPLTSRTRSGLTDHEEPLDDDDNDGDDGHYDAVPNDAVSCAITKKPSGSYSVSTNKLRDTPMDKKDTTVSRINRVNNPFASPTHKEGATPSSSCVSSQRRLRRTLAYRDTDSSVKTHHDPAKWFHKLGMFRADTSSHQMDRDSTTHSATNTTFGTFSTSLTESKDSETVHLDRKASSALNPDLVSFDETS